MKTSQALTDKISMGLSLSCALHCLLIPLLLISIPSTASLTITDEAFHMWMVIAVIPTSLYALSLGCKEHKRYHFLFMGFIGLTLLIAALMLGEKHIGHSGEQILTVLGSGFLVLGHWFNFRCCQKSSQKDCNC